MQSGINVQMDNSTRMIECMHFYMVLYRLGPECMHFYLVLYRLGPECMHFYITFYCIMIEFIHFYSDIAPGGLHNRDLYSKIVLSPSNGPSTLKMALG